MKERIEDFSVTSHTFPYISQGIILRELDLDENQVYEAAIFYERVQFDVDPHTNVFVTWFIWYWIRLDWIKKGLLGLKQRYALYSAIVVISHCFLCF